MKKTNYEILKTILLIILVTSSIFLTLNIWTYQPSYSSIDEEAIVENVSIGTEKELDDVISPTRIIYSVNNNLIYGTINPIEIQAIMQEFKKWDFSMFTDITARIDDFYSFLNETNQLQINYAVSVPMSLYKSSLDSKNNLLPNFNFDNIILKLSNDNDEFAKVYFVSTKTKEVYESLIPASYVTGIENNYLTEIQSNQNYAILKFKELKNNRRIYYKADTNGMYSYQHLFMTIDADKFKNALFKNPDLVQRNAMISGTEYTDGFSVLRIYDNFTISYINPSEMLQSVNTLTTSSIKKSIDYINSHAGWNYNYQLVSNDIVNNKLEFRMYYPDGLPIFSDSPGLATINLGWGNSGIVEYFRGNFTLGVEMEKFEMDVASGETVLNYLENMEEINLENIEDLTLAYKIKREGASRIVYLLPTWYYKMADVWYEVQIDYLGRGQLDGLE